MKNTKNNQADAASDLSVSAGYLRHELNRAKANCDKWHSEWCDSDGMMDSFDKSNADYWKGRRDALQFLIKDNTKDNHE